MRTRFQQGLDDLRSRLLRMGGLAEQAVDRACQAYIDRDLARCHLVLEGESLINAAERDIDEQAFDLLAKMEGILPALESSHAIAKAAKLAADMPKDQILVICLSGRGDKDAAEIARLKGVAG